MITDGPVGGLLGALWAAQGGPLAGGWRLEDLEPATPWGSLALLAAIGAAALAGAVALALLPRWVALRRGHPHVAAVTLCGVLGLFIFPLAWLAALVWAMATPPPPPPPETAAR